MVENNQTQVVNNKGVHGFNIAALVLGIVSIVSWCAWFISIPCSILALVFGIIGMKKQGRPLAITGVVTGAIALAIWVILFLGAFMYGFMEEIDDDDYSYNYRSSRYLD